MLGEVLAMLPGLPWPIKVLVTIALLVETWIAIRFLVWLRDQF